MLSANTSALGSDVVETENVDSIEMMSDCACASYSVTAINDLRFVGAVMVSAIELTEAGHRAVEATTSSSTFSTATARRARDGLN